jgi:hypothetical protein
LKVDCFDKSKEWAKSWDYRRRAAGDGQRDAGDLGAGMEFSALGWDAPPKNDPHRCTT